MEAEEEQATGEVEVKVKVEATRAEETIVTITIITIITTEETIDGGDIETTARRCNLGNMTLPKNLLQAVEGARNIERKAQ